MIGEEMENNYLQSLSWEAGQLGFQPVILALSPWNTSSFLMRQRLQELYGHTEWEVSGHPVEVLSWQLASPLTPRVRTRCVAKAHATLTKRQLSSSRG